jgi:protein TonB
MEPKKNPVVDVHRYRGTLFSIGLITSIILVLMAFQWKTKVKTRPLPRYDSSPPELVYQVPITDHTYAEQKIKRVKNPINFIEVKNEDLLSTDDIVVEEPMINESVTIVEPFVEIPDEPVSNEPWINVDVMPQPENGYEGFYNLLRKEMKYPTKSRLGNIEGKVFVQFVISEDGSISQQKIIKGIGGGCDEEALRVLSLSKWKPGKQRGRPVKVRMVLPIHFKLSH